MRMLDKVDELLKRDGLKQADLARMIGVAPARLSRWKGGEGEPTARQALRIARALKCPLEWLVDDEQADPSSAPVELTNADKTILLAIRELGLSFEGALQRLSGPITYAEGAPRQAQRGRGNHDGGAA